jgi:hypothetical protein
MSETRETANVDVDQAKPAIPVLKRPVCMRTA